MIKILIFTITSTSWNAIVYFHVTVGDFDNFDEKNLIFLQISFTAVPSWLAYRLHRVVIIGPKLKNHCTWPDDKRNCSTWIFRHEIKSRLMCSDETINKNKNWQFRERSQNLKKKTIITIRFEVVYAIWKRR